MKNIFSNTLQNDDKPGDYTYDADATEEDDEGIGKEPLPPGMDEDDDLKPPGEEDEDKGIILSFSAFS